MALVALAAAAPLAQAGDTASTGGICEGHVFSQPLAAFGDFSNYLPATGGDFESGLDGFALSGGAALQDGNQPFDLAGVDDGHSLALPPGSSATTPPMCVTSDYPTMRLFARGEREGKLKVEVVYTDAVTGKRAVSGVGDIDAKATRGTWVLSKVFPTLAGKKGTALSVRLSADPKGAWSVDDVLVDPHSRG